MDIKELRITTPWGFIAAKAWGNENSTPVLMFHGILDNAGTFDRLIPLLPRTFYYICIDLPGHGKSSYFPPHVPLHVVNYIFAYKIIMASLTKEKYIVIAHSWGGQLALLFAQLYPEHVSKLILLDAVHLFLLTVDNFKDQTKERMEQFLKAQNKSVGTTPSYTYTEALDKLLNNRILGGLTRDAAKALLKRSLIPVGGGKFQFAIDPRMKFPMRMIYGAEFMDDCIKKYPVLCPVLFIFAADSMPHLSYFDSFINEIKNQNDRCYVKVVKGNHDVHSNQPETVAAVINPFLTSASSKL